MYNTKEGKSCVIYIRVSSERQVKGYSLDGQKHYLAEWGARKKQSPAAGTAALHPMGIVW